MRDLVELVGLPGGGKTTISRALARSGKIESIRNALRRSVGHWYAREILGMPHSSFLFGNELFLRLYSNRSIENLRASYRAEPEIIRLFAGFILPAGIEERPHEMRCVENMATFLELVSRDQLLTRYLTPHGRPILADEHWIQFVFFVMNWGIEDHWRNWALEMLDNVSLPTRVIWLRNVAALSESRQVARGRLAAMFRGCDDIASAGSMLERRAESLQPELERRGVRVICVDAAASHADIMAAVISEF